MLRCAAPVATILATVYSLVGGDVDIEELSRAEPIEFFTAGQTPGPAVPFNTDAHTLAPLEARMMLMGPGDMRCAHADGEQLDVEDLRTGIEAFARLVARLA